MLTVPAKSHPDYLIRLHARQQCKPASTLRIQCSGRDIIINNIVQRAPFQCIVSLAANNLQSGLSSASSVASSTLRLWNDRSFFTEASQEVWGHQPFPNTLRNCCKNSAGISWLIHSYQVAKQHQAPLLSLLNNRGERWLFSYLPHFTFGHMLTPVYIKDSLLTSLANSNSNNMYFCK